MKCLIILVIVGIFFSESSASSEANKQLEIDRYEVTAIESALDLLDVEAQEGDIDSRNAYRAFFSICEGDFPLVNSQTMDKLVKYGLATKDSNDNEFLFDPTAIDIWKRRASIVRRYRQSEKQRPPNIFVIPENVGALNGEE